MSANHDIKLLEKCRVAPPPDAVDEFTLPLTFYDLPYLLPIRNSNQPRSHVYFYRFHHPCPTSPHSIIPSLKSSLSLALKHFLPLAGNLIFPIDSGDRLPELRYMKGDSVPLTIAESKEDFDYLVGDHQRDSYKIHCLLPQLPEPFLTSSYQLSPVFSLQVTLFPNSGVSIGHTFLHVVGDVSTFKNFIKSWASINKFHGNYVKFLPAFSHPVYDRFIIHDPFQLSRKIFNDIKHHKFYDTPRISSPNISKDEVHATFILNPNDIIKLKGLISKKTSTFTVTCALMWTCFLKSRDLIREEKVKEDTHETMSFAVNYRQRLNPPIPQNYFGNCMVPCYVKSTHGKLVGNEGFSIAATSIGDAIHRMVHGGEEIFKGGWLLNSQSQSTTATHENLIIIGSTQKIIYNYNIDFGWGELVKHEYVSINASSTIRMLINLSKRFEGAIEFGLSLPKNRMDAFTTIFTNCIDNLYLKSPM